MSDVTEKLKSLSTQIVEAWGHVSSGDFQVSPPGVLGEIVCDSRDFKKKAAVFRVSLETASNDVYGVLLNKYGTAEVRGPLRLLIRELVSSMTAAIPLSLRETPGATFTSSYLLHYAAAAGKTRMGEAILSCYPRCGIPCGWDEREGVLYLYQPDLKKA